MKTIKTTIFFAFLAIMALMPLSAQQFQKGTIGVNLGIGVGTAWSGLGNGRPAINLSAEYGMADAGPGVISLGGFVENVGYKYQDGSYTQKWKFTVLGVRGVYHYNGFTSVPKLDPYAGLMLGYNLVSYKASGESYMNPNSYGSGMGFAFFVGSRWFFTNSMGAFAELGYGASILKAGVAFKF